MSRREPGGLRETDGLLGNALARSVFQACRGDQIYVGAGEIVQVAAKLEEAEEGR